MNRAFIIRELSREHPVAFYYLSRTDRDPALQMAMSLLKQLCLKFDFVPPCLLEPDQNRLVRPLNMVLMKVAFEELLTKHKNFIVVADGVGEAADPNDADDVRDFLSFTASLGILLLGTSRGSTDVPFDRCPSIEIQGAKHNDDIKKFISNAIKNREHRYKISNELIPEVTQRISVTVSGRYVI